VETLDEARDHLRVALETRPVLTNLTCPTYVLHGSLDEIPMTFIDTLQAHVTEADLTIVIEREGDHCCHNLGMRPRYEMADWLADTLGADARS
jgi:2,6-dihydroxypseudooxynicotine hydrolase